VYVTGQMGAAGADFNPGGSGGVLTSAGASDAFVAKYDPSGTFLWAKSMGGSLVDQGRGAAVDGNGNVYIAGHFGAPGADFNPGGSGGALTSAGGVDVFVAKYDAGGTFLWAKSGGGTNADNCYGVAVDAYGYVCVTGYFAAQGANFHPGGSGGALTSAGGAADVFVVKYDPNGTFLWARSGGGPGGTDAGYGVVASANGNVYVTGNFSATADFNLGGSGGTLSSAGTIDVFVMKLACRDTSSSYLAAFIECGSDYILNGETYTTAGSYTQHFPNAAGCDSSIILDLIIYPIEAPVISVDGFVLGVTGTYTTYQWIKNGVEIPGATNDTYTVTENADYQVKIINENGCEATSDIYAVTNYNVHINDATQLKKQIRVYPNPSRDIIYISSPVAVHLLLTKLEGRTVQNRANATHISVKDLPEGMYFLRVLDKQNNLIKVEKVVVGN
jgi:hypothetical protein